MPQPNSPLIIRPLQILTHPLKNFHKIMIRISTPVPHTRIRERLPIPRASRDVRRYHDVALLGEDCRVPAGAPGVFPGRVRPAVDEVGDWVFFRSGEGAGFDYPGVYGWGYGWV